MQILSKTFAIGSIIGKLLMVVHRYLVINSSDLSENVSSNPIYLVPTSPDILVTLIFLHCFSSLSNTIVMCLPVPICQRTCNIHITCDFSALIFCCSLPISVRLQSLTLFGFALLDLVAASRAVFLIIRERLHLHHFQVSFVPVFSSELNHAIDP